MASAGRVAALPMFVRLAAHPLRWQLLTELATGDYRVRELVARVDQPQNLVSYHLRLLRDGGLVTATRSTFDGRDSYYHLDIDRCAQAMTNCGATLHPALSRVAGAPVPLTEQRRYRGISVLFVCTGNTGRSPIAEALLRHQTAGHVTVASAGSQPKPRLHPHALRVLRETFGIDISSQRPQHLDSLADRTFDQVITLCDRAREVCRQFRHDPQRIHWSIPDPAMIDDTDDTDDAGYPAFQRTAADIDTRVRHLLAVLAPPTDERDQPWPHLTSTPASDTSSTTCRPPSTSTPPISASTST